MRIPIRLIPQGVIPRDPNLQFQAQRVSDVLRAAGATVGGAATDSTPPEISTILPLHDSFAGTTGLSVLLHLADTVHSWQWADFCGTDTGLTLNGAGELTTAGCGAVLSSALLPSDTYKITVRFRIVRGNGIGQLSIAAQYDDTTPATPFNYITFVQGFDGSTTSNDVAAVIVGDNIGSTTQTFPVVSDADVVRELVFDVIAGEATITLDGVAVGTNTMLAQAGTRLLLNLQWGLGATGASILLDDLRVE